MQRLDACACAEHDQGAGRPSQTPSRPARRCRAPPASSRRHQVRARRPRRRGQRGLGRLPLPERRAYPGIRVGRGGRAGQRGAASRQPTASQRAHVPCRARRVPSLAPQQPWMARYRHMTSTRSFMPGQRPARLCARLLRAAAAAAQHDRTASGVQQLPHPRAPLHKPAALRLTCERT